MKRCIAFDVDETLTISNGPIDPKYIKALHDAGQIVGICGNAPLFVRAVPEWEKYVSFLGQFYPHMTKETFLQWMKAAVVADEYVMVGNDPAHYGASNDIAAARTAGWRFVREDQFRIEDFFPL